MVYKFNPSYHSKVNAQVAGEVCEELSNGGRLTAQNLVDISEPEDAPLHRAFEWDNKVAGNEWRKHQARNLIHSLEIVKDETPPAKAYFNLERTEAEYTSVDVILRSEDLYQKMMNNALNELKAFKKKYQTLSALQPLFDVIEQIEEEGA